MSRVGKQPVSIPAGVEVKIDGEVIRFKNGKLTEDLDTKGNVKVELKDNSLEFTSNRSGKTPGIKGI